MSKTAASNIIGKMIQDSIKEESVFFNFPVSLLDELLDYPSGTFEKMLAWASYDYILRNQEINEHGSDSLHGETGWKRIKPAAQALQYTHNGNMVKWYKYCGEIHNTYKGARTGLSQKQYWELREGFTSMLDEDKVVLLAFLAAKSILGSKVYCKTNDLLLFARMNGLDKAFANNQELKYKSHPVIASFDTRRKKETIRRRLIDDFHINCYSNHDRGYYISSKLSLNKLAEVVEANRKNTIKTHKNKVAAARAMALAKLKPP